MSCEDLWECAPPEREDIAESMEDVLGGPRPISIRCLGAVAAIGGRVVVVGEPPEGFEVRTGSETLREGPFVSWTGRLYLNEESASCIAQALIPNT